MRAMFGYVLVKKDQLISLKEKARRMEEYKAIADDTEIGKQKREKENEYKNYFGRWYETGYGICQIRGIYYDRHARLLGQMEVRRTLAQHG